MSWFKIGRKSEVQALSDITMGGGESATSWLVQNLIPMRGVSIVAGCPKVGKSTLARNLALAVSAGRSFLDRATKSGPVVYYSMEERAPAIKEQFLLHGAADVDLTRIFLSAGARPRKPYVELRNAIKEHRPALVVIDTMARFLPKADSNHYSQMTEALNPLLEIVSKFPCHILLVHHAKKNAPPTMDAILGSTAIFGSVDTAMLLAEKDDGLALIVRQRHQADSDFAIEFDRNRMLKLRSPPILHEIAGSKNTGQIPIDDLAALIAQKLSASHGGKI